MIQKFRHIVHLVLAFFSDYLSLLGRPLFYQLQFQHFKCEFDNKVQPKRLCLLGNGPTFNQIEEHLEALNDFDFCAVNLSVNTDIFFRVKPKMYVIVDMMFWQQPEKEGIKECWDNIQKIDWDITICIPFNFPTSMKRTFERNPFVKVRRYSNNVWRPELRMANKLKLWLYKKGWVSPNATNVSVGAIFASILNGYKEINLLGLEHSWMKDIRVNDRNEVVLMNRHYYGDVEHVWRDYEGKPIKLVDFLASQLETFTSHLDLRRFVDYLGDVRIINRTKGSYIDAYERETFEKMLESSR